MIKAKAVVVGFGDRGERYCAYALSHPDKLQIIAAIDTNPLKLRLAQKIHDIPNEMLFDNISSFLARNITCDIVINATMDQIHYETTIQLLKAKYNVLLEKPITPNPRELFDLQKEAEKNNCIIMVCHVLRYTSFYAKLKQLIYDGEIGEITDMQLNEHIGFSHFVKSYVRGKWKNEKECGNGLLLAKCCHDLDLICWLNNITKPEYVSSFGSKSTYSIDKAPANSADFCYRCEVKDSCMYNAYEFELKKDFIPFYTWAGINKPLEDITLEEKIEYLKTSDYGRCVYRTNMDIVDRQCVSIEFKNGSIATLNMVGAASKAGRHIHVLGTKGELSGYIEHNKINLTKINPKTLQTDYWEFDTDLSKTESEDNAVSGHFGGDYYIMKDVVSFLNSGKTSLATTLIEDSIDGHLCGYAAEKSRTTRHIVPISHYKSK